MKNNRLLKIYLITACISVMLFLGSFAIGWHMFDSMADIYGATLPFLLISIGSLTAFGFTPSVKENKEAKTLRAKAKVVPLKVYHHSSHNCFTLRKIS